MTLEGRTVLTTRSGSQSSELRDLLAQLGAAVVEIPTIEIVPPQTWEPVDRAISSLADYDWVVLTSANAAEAFCGRLDGRALPPLAAVGGKTARRLEELGHPVAIIPEDYRAQGLLKALPEDLGGLRILLPRALVAGEDLPAALRGRGAEVEVVTVYRTRRPKEGAERLRRLIGTGRIDCVTITSGSTASNLLEMLGSDDPTRRLQGLTVASIGPVTTAAARAVGIEVHVEAPTATAESLAGAISQHFRDRTEDGDGPPPES